MLSEPSIVRYLLTVSIYDIYHLLRFGGSPEFKSSKSYTDEPDSPHRLSIFRERSIDKHVNTPHYFKLNARRERPQRTCSFLRSPREGTQETQNQDRFGVSGVGSGFTAHSRRVRRDLRR